MLLSPLVLLALMPKSDADIGADVVVGGGPVRGVEGWPSRLLSRAINQAGYLPTNLPAIAQAKQPTTS